MAETYELTTKTKQDLDFVFEKKSAEIMAVAAPNVKLDEAYLTRCKLTALANPDVIKVLSTSKGMRTFVESVTNTAMIGLSFGGPRPQAYFVPKDGGILAIYEASGYKYACTYGPGAVLAEYPRTIVVHEGDTVKVDPDAGTIIYKEGGYNPFDPNRGRVAGYLMRLVYNDGRKPEIRECPMTKVKKIQQGHSMLNSPMFNKDVEEADLKTAEKSMLRLAFKESCQRAQVMVSGDDEFDETPPVINRDPESRMASRMDKAAASMKPAERVDEPELEQEPEAASESGDATKAEGAQPGTEELF